jgi:hypothetical protein
MSSLFPQNTVTHQPPPPPPPPPPPKKKPKKTKTQSDTASPSVLFMGGKICDTTPFFKKFTTISIQNTNL